jgi:hypothetical protein
MFATRIAAIKASANLTGIDFVAVEADQTTLRVHFHRNPATLPPLARFTSSLPLLANITIVSINGGEGIPVVRVTGVSVDVVDTVEILELTTDQPGDFSRYRLTIEDSRLDYFFKSSEFSFKAGCVDTSIDCKPTLEPCPPLDLVDFPVDYMARDFLSLRGALMDFARQRYPQWGELIEADVGVMVLELFAALGDELSYTQDRMAREAYLETATQRRSLRRLTRLVDYNIHDGRSGSTFLDVQVKSDAVAPLNLPAGTRVWVVADGGESLAFELGEGLADFLAGKTFSVRKEWNALLSYAFDPDAAELSAGATKMYVVNDAAEVSPASLWENKWVLLQRDPIEPGEPARRHLVFVTDVTPVTDELMGIDLLLLSWETEHALPWCLKLGDETTVHGNLVQATAGERTTEYFEVRGTTPDARQAIEREGPLSVVTGERSVTFLHSLLSTETGGLGRIGSDLRETTPELRVARVVDPLPEALSAWTWRRTLLSSTPLDEHYTLDDGTWRRVVGFQRATVEKDFVHIDYASGDGTTLQFGDGDFGKVPADGLRFRVDYRTGPGSASNVGAGTIRNLLDPSTGAVDPLLLAVAGDIASITNPLPVTDGVDPESLEDVRQLAPEEFRAITHRAVAPEDFCEVARRLDWVQIAGVRQRWTGSWPTTFVTPDPVAAYALTDDQRAEFTGLMDCVRQAGREVHVRDPRFRAIDLEIQICIKPGHLPSSVRDAVLFSLRGDGLNPGYFGPDAFTFGAPLHRLTLEGIVGAVPGVLAVKDVKIGARAIHDMRKMEPLYAVPDDQILRLANDPRTPERGSIRVITEGGV